MSGVALKPRKRIRHEILSLVPLAVVAGALFFAFPFATLGMKRPDNAVEPTGNSSCVYVELTDEEESWAMSIVRSGISTDVRSVRDLRADLSLSIIPEREHSFVMDVNDRKRAREHRNNLSSGINAGFRTRSDTACRRPRDGKRFFKRRNAETHRLKGKPK